MINSVISLDLGGKNTGFFSFSSNNILKIDKFQSGTIIYDENFVLSQVKRRGKRHTKRNNLRNKLVKRLFLLILQKHFDLKIEFLPDEILGLFNKRGYTYAGFEIKEEEKEQLESKVLKDFLDDKLEYIIKNDNEIEDFLNQIASNEETFKKYKKDYENLYNAIVYKPNKQFELIEDIKKEFEKSEAKELLDGLKIVKKMFDEFDKQQNQGNLPRVKYFEELNIEIEKNPKIQEFLTSHNLKIEDMQNLIGNLSNYQLKELRRYFNDENMKNGDIWNAEQLHKVTWRFIQSCHAKNEDKVRQKENLKELKAKNIIEFLTYTNPKMTIPPYDDMNNRGAVKCQSLRLNESYLDIHMPNWRNIAQKLASENQKENLSDATIRNWSEDSTLFHRILDTSKEIDSYNLRSDKPDSYIDILGKNDALNLQKFAKNYYELIRSKVRTGIWTSSDNMLKKCNHNPPYKNNQIHNLVAGILGIKITAEQFLEFENKLWNKKFGNKKLSSYCKNIEELRKSHGNLFKSYIEELFKEDKKSFSKEEQKDKKLLNEKVLNEWVEEIGKFFSIEEKYRARFNNHFSMAQFHTIIDTKRSGFNSTCKWCSAENQYRTSTNVEINSDTGEVNTNANAQRLPADTQRPFSGKIERYIDKLGYEIAKIKAKEIEEIDDKKIDLKIILEQNAFEYEESIRSAKIKNANAKAKKSLEDAKKRGLKNLEDKNSRIKSFSAGICPYCGENLGKDGEVDHILPRSYTLKIFDTVFNSEGNLLFVHQKCNQAKK
jgi:CRISPR system subtype II-B RNA-guided endonuclease Cas9/Csx12